MLISFGGITKITGYGALAFAPREIGEKRVKGRRVHSAPEQIIGGREDDGHEGADTQHTADDTRNAGPPRREVAAAESRYSGAFLEDTA